MPKLDEEIKSVSALNLILIAWDRIDVPEGHQRLRIDDVGLHLCFSVRELGIIHAEFTIDDYDQLAEVSCYVNARPRADPKNRKKDKLSFLGQDGTIWEGAGMIDCDYVAHGMIYLAESGDCWLDRKLCAPLMSQPMAETLAALHVSRDGIIVPKGFQWVRS